MSLSSGARQEVTQLTAGEIAARIRAGDYCCREVVEAHIERIEETHEQLNAVVVPLFGEARRAAERADQALRRAGPAGPLHGVPVTVKEMFAVAGTPATAGIQREKVSPASEDAALVARLRDAGAIILGKTNVPQLGLAFETVNPVYGRTNNPWRLDRSPGGSSGGEAAIVAAGGSPLGLGSDGGGSIRQPAHACGVCGFKPTTGRLSMRGHWQYVTFPRGFAQAGLMARSVADLDLALRLLVRGEPDAREGKAAPAALGNLADVDFENLRIGLYSSDAYVTPAPAIRRAVQQAGMALRERGAVVEDFAPPDPEQAWRIFFALLSADGGYYARKELGTSPREQYIRQNLSVARIPSLARPLIAGTLKLAGQRHLADAFGFTPRRALSAVRYLALLRERDCYRSSFLSAVDERGFDAILCPPNAVPAAIHDSRYVNYTALYTALYNLLGMPAGVVPITRVREGEESDRHPGSDAVLRDLQRSERGSTGLPVGVQVVARHWRDDVALAVMSCLEQKFRGRADFPERPPLVSG